MPQGHAQASGSTEQQAAKPVKNPYILNSYRVLVEKKMSGDKTVCPHCGVKMQKWRTPPQATWSPEFFLYMLNDHPHNTLAENHAVAWLPVGYGAGRCTQSLLLT
jgi:hypothetical protein